MKNEAPCIKYINPRNESLSLDARQILIVDDNLEVSQVVVQMLEHLGYLSVSCGHAQEALVHLQSQKFDLMLIDYRMPEMTGLDLILLLRQEGCNVPIVMMTGYTATEDRILSEKIGDFTILKKPIALPELAEALEESLDSKAKLSPRLDGKDGAKD